MSALPPKADVCSAGGYVRYGPEADMPFSGSRASSQSFDQKETAEVRGGFFQYGTRSCALVEVSSWSLIQCIGDILELGVERATNRIDGRDDHDRNASGDQAVLDSSGA